MTQDSVADYLNPALKPASLILSHPIFLQHLSNNTSSLAPCYNPPSHLVVREKFLSLADNTYKSIISNLALALSNPLNPFFLGLPFYCLLYHGENLEMIMHARSITLLSINVSTPIPNLTAFPPTMENQLSPLPQARPHPLLLQDSATS